MSKSVNNTQDLGRLSGELTKTYSALADNTPGAIFTTTSIDVGQRIRASVQQLGSACADLIKDAGHLQGEMFFRSDALNTQIQRATRSPKRDSIESKLKVAISRISDY